MPQCNRAPQHLRQKRSNFTELRHGTVAVAGPAVLGRQLRAPDAEVQLFSSWSSRGLLCQPQSANSFYRSALLVGHRPVASFWSRAPWLCGAVYTLLRVDTAEEQEIMLNLTLALLLDLMMVRLLKKLVRRRMPAQNRSDILSTFFVEKYSFPSGHATRAALCARFLMAQLVDNYSMRVLVLGWASLVSLSRLLLARHYVTDVGFGLAMGYCQYGLVERLWVSWDCLQDILLLKVKERFTRAYSQLWTADCAL
ncbi:hypothetical protein WMY93_000760 [Mugilogobius chulae]|uniref:Polyisoprenoid diphosphate/phosphate phosphohydrolase PLPP6 n=1 Tax=Mugilogobius chulae TaxID=88201 RepID=A0AAW0Q3B3_9GOBI